tara:strand:+ start:43 stop:534 length:492 start_codon:yes stop_codon:yes gene_type:complete
MKKEKTEKTISYSTAEIIQAYLDQGDVTIGNTLKDPETIQKMVEHGYVVTPAKKSKMYAVLQAMINSEQPTSLSQYEEFRVLNLPAYIFSLKAMNWKIKNLKPKGEPALYDLDFTQRKKFLNDDLVVYKSTIRFPKFDHKDPNESTSPMGSSERQSYSIGGLV